MEIERDITVEPESDAESAFTTFLGAAPEMPTFSEEELAVDLDPAWVAKMDSLFEVALADRDEDPDKDAKGPRPGPPPTS